MKFMEICKISSVVMMLCVPLSASAENIYLECIANNIDKDKPIKETKYILVVDSVDRSVRFKKIDYNSVSSGIEFESRAQVRPDKIVFKNSLFPTFDIEYTIDRQTLEIIRRAKGNVTARGICEIVNEEIGEGKIEKN